jgi:hypothetical protein
MCVCVCCVCVYILPEAGAAGAAPVVLEGKGGAMAAGLTGGYMGCATGF